jgi:Family of unknown function (DUF5694)
MKNILFAFLFFSSSLAAQNIEVLLIGTSHNYSKNPPQDFSKIHQTIRAFKPDAFFGEYRSKEDERLLMAYWCKTYNNERIERLQKKRPIAEKDLSKVIADFTAKTAQNPNDWQSRIDLAHAYFLDQDVSNGRFQMWQAYHNKQTPVNQEIFEYSKLVLSPDMDSLHKAIKNYGSSEYDYIAYPMVMEMGFKEIYPMDCQVYDLNYSAAVDSLWTKYNLFQKDTVNKYTADFKKWEKKMYDGQRKEREIEKTDKYFTEFINTDEAGKIAASFDYFLPEMYDFNGFPKEEVLAALHWWEMRNVGMCENTVTRARKFGVKRVVVLAGASHRQYMQAIFQKMPNVKVWNINEFGK